MKQHTSYFAASLVWRMRKSQGFANRIKNWLRGLSLFFMVKTATRKLFCHVFINRNVKTKIYSCGHFYFIGWKTADKIVVAKNRMITPFLTRKLFCRCKISQFLSIFAFGIRLFKVEHFSRIYRWEFWLSLNNKYADNMQLNRPWKVYYPPDIINT